jgi:lipoate-protein ligase A
MQFLDLTLPQAAENLALEEALLQAAESGDDTEVLRVWEWPSPAVVLGSGGRLAEDVNETACRADGVPILRRSSGGGTVLLGRGCLNYSLVLQIDANPALSSITTSYAFILGRVALGLGLEGISQAGISDLVFEGRKVSGNSQQRKRTCLLHHGTLLYAFDISSIDRYLPVPQRQPPYRAGRNHRDFLRNLPLSAYEVKGRLRSAWHAEQELSAWPQHNVTQLVVEKYSLASWVHRR